MNALIEACYGKKVGLPNFSSHHYSLSVRAELDDLDNVGRESARLYEMLQGAVERALAQPESVPEELTAPAAALPVGNGESAQTTPRDPDRWQCSEKQKDLILAIIEEQRLNQDHVEWLAQERFGRGLRGLSRLEASAIISKLLTR